MLLVHRSDRFSSMGTDVMLTDLLRFKHGPPPARITTGQSHGSPCTPFGWTQLAILSALLNNNLNRTFLDGDHQANGGISGVPESLYEWARTSPDHRQPMGCPQILSKIPGILQTDHLYAGLAPNKQGGMESNCRLQLILFWYQVHESGNHSRESSMTIPSKPRTETCRKRE
ncbi:hypothetical protein ASPFODRAFT_597543 [Aspergillus luchuensis CBS 106.47]|uniref:Uncharacterized protein n=1 Tax=Aspergillus luchuensis (strain CBS 106.47) TaxID=1137211 RepID=A0A1M3TI56_ASPLC|nr:hypothetical protein ASPFODRAFT_597543 [Aspergillus luchuensis CBS 106.47]